MNQDLIAPCGMNCGLCVSYQFGQHDLNQHGFHRRYCPGCIPRGKHCTFMASSCSLVGKGKVRFCYECPTFPCKRLKDLDIRYKNKYHMSMIDNLKMIQLQGMDEFLSQQSKIWECPTCHQLKCCHNGLCLVCQWEILKEKPTYRVE